MGWHLKNQGLFCFKGLNIAFNFILKQIRIFENPLFQVSSTRIENTVGLNWTFPKSDIKSYVGCQILTDVATKNSVIWNITTLNPLKLNCLLRAGFFLGLIFRL